MNKNPLIIDMDPQEFTINITKVGNEWRVDKPKSSQLVPAATLSEGAGFGHLGWPNKFRGDRVTWTLTGPPAAAYFQFPAELFDDPAQSGVLSKHMTATIPATGGQLTLSLHAKADRRVQPHNYAVWIQEENGKGQYACGSNPPPEINVGP